MKDIERFCTEINTEVHEQRKQEREKKAFPPLPPPFPWLYDKKSADDCYIVDIQCPNCKQVIIVPCDWKTKEPIVENYRFCPNCGTGRTPEAYTIEDIDKFFRIHKT